MQIKYPVLVLLFFFMWALINPSPTLAARQRVRKPSGGGQAYVARGVGATVRFRPDRLGLVLNFYSFDNVESGSYELVYDSGGVTQGAGGSIIIGDTSPKELLFATCSHGVCRFHENITNARLSIISKLNSGQTVLKPFRIKV